MNPNIEKAFHDYEALIAKENKPAAFYNGIYTRYENPVLTRDHIPPFWKFDLNEETNPLGLERLGVNAVMELRRHQAERSVLPRRPRRRQ